MVACLFNNTKICVSLSNPTSLLRCTRNNINKRMLTFIIIICTIPWFIFIVVGECVAFMGICSWLSWLWWLSWFILKMIFTSKWQKSVKTSNWSDSIITYNLLTQHLPSLIIERTSVPVLSRPSETKAAGFMHFLIINMKHHVLPWPGGTPSNGLYGGLNPKGIPFSDRNFISWSIYMKE